VTPLVCLPSSSQHSQHVLTGPDTRCQQAPPVCGAVTSPPAFIVLTASSNALMACGIGATHSRHGVLLLSAAHHSCPSTAEAAHSTDLLLRAGKGESTPGCGPGFLTRPLDKQPQQSVLRVCVAAAVLLLY
jgi:hypothetical protein